jgi:thioredoxin 1
MLFNVNDAQFEEKVLQNQRPVLVDGWAPSCKPCVGMHPVLEALAAEFEGRIDVAKIDVDQIAETARAYGIRSLPTWMMVNKGVVLGKKLGVMPRQQIVDWMHGLLGDDAASRTSP